MISAFGWMLSESVSKTPQKYILNEADYERFMSQAQEQISRVHQEAKDAGIDLTQEMMQDVAAAEDRDGGEADADVEPTKTAAADGDLEKYNLDEYDAEAADSTDDDSEAELDVKDAASEDLIFTPLNQLLAKAKSGDAATHNNRDAVDEEMEEEELDDLTVRPSDALFVCAKTEDEISQLEIYLFEENNEIVPTGEANDAGDNLYVHHDVMLSSFPLCLEWCGFKGGMSSSGASSNGCSVSGSNFVAVGTFEPEIEIWNLDLLETVYPILTLGGNPGKGHGGLVHSDAVMSLAWNRNCQNFLASGSADSSILLWDLNSAVATGAGIKEALRAFTHHQGKVQALRWNPVQVSGLLSAAYDGVVRYFDVRAPQDGIQWDKGCLGGDVEQIKWRSEHCWAASDESGRVSFFDIRMAQTSASTAAPLLTINAHSKSVTCFDFCPLNPNLLLTASLDKSLKLWSVPLGSETVAPVACLTSKSCHEVGKIFTAGFLPDKPYVIVAGGSRGNVESWNLRREDVIIDFFKSNQ